MKSDSRCPYCGNEYPTITIPAPFGAGTYTVRSSSCGCEGEAEATRVQARTLRQAELTRAWHGTKVPKRFRDVTPDYNLLGQLEFSGGLYLHGPKGTGKTTTACKVLKAYVSRNQRDGWVSAKFVSVPDFLASMRGTWEEEDAFEIAAGCKLLVLDDMGKGKPTEWAMERLFRLIDRRYNDKIPTIITSQYSLSELGGKCSSNGDVETAEAMVSRIHEMCATVGFNGPDLRQKS